MIRRNRQMMKALGLVAPVLLVFAACGGTSVDTSSGSASDGGGSGASGEVFISGSSTVQPISVLVAEMFEDVEPDVYVDVEGPGTGDGFKKFCEGETDISNASRQIKEAEAQACAAAGIEFTEILVGIDGIAVMTNSANDTVDCLTFENLFNLIGAPGEGTATWAAADATLPDVPLNIFGPGAESGTFDSFIELVLEDLAHEAGVDAGVRTDYNPSAEDNLILSGIQSSDTALGWVGFAFAGEADVKLLDVDGGDGCVAASAETIASNEYPIARNLYMYVNDGKVAENPGLKAFVDFYVADGLDDAVAEVGYVALSDAAKDEVRAGWSQ